MMLRLRSLIRSPRGAGVSTRVPSPLLVAAFFALAGAPGLAHAIDANDALADAQRDVSAASGAVGSIQQAVQKSRQSERTPQQKIADALMLMGAKDWDSAAQVLNQIVEKHADHPTAYPDGLSMLGETYYQSGQLWSARRAFKKIVDQGNDPRFSSYQAKAVARLVDVAVRKKDDKLLDEVLPLLDRVPAEASGLVPYARGRALFQKKDYPGARTALGGVDDQSPFVHQARYMAGLVAIKEAGPPPVAADPSDPPPPAPPSRYAAAVDAFTKATQLPAKTPAQKHVVELSWLAIARLFYESEQWNQALSAYNRIDRSSPEFGTMLYELAWVYVRLGDVDRARRALEVLQIADPNNQDIADASLLRGDLLLRAGQFDGALQIYEGTRATYDPMREKVDAFLGSTSDPAVYFDKLRKDQLESLEGGVDLPPQALQWAREAENGPAAFAIIDDLDECRELIKASNQHIETLEAVLTSPNRVRAFPELKAGQERALALVNSIALARLKLGQGMDDVEDDDLGGEIGEWRRKRRALEARLARVPTSEADFATRDRDAERQWNKVSQSVQRLELQTQTLQATVNGLRRMIQEGPQMGVVRDPASISSFQTELQTNEQLLATYRREMDDLRSQIRRGRLQAGFGDQRYVEDEEVRKAHREALGNEVRLASNGAGGASLQAYAGRVQPLLASADAADDRISAVRAELDAETERRTSGVRADVDKERSALTGYEARLGELDTESRQVVGEVAMRNFGLVRDRLKNIVLRADVGITEHAWEVREEQITRVRMLQRERARELRVLTEELNEVLDDAGEPAESSEGAAPPAAPGGSK